MEIMSLNGWGGKLHQPLCDYLGQTQPDVLCLQEVVHSPATNRDWLTYRDGAHVLPQRANFLRDVAEALPDHTHTFCPAAEGVLWDGDQPVASQWGLATFVRRSIPIVGQIQGFVHKTYSPDGYGDHPRSRSAHAVRLWDKRLGQAVTIAQMHGLRDLAGKHDTPERAVQAHRLLGLVDSIAEPGDGRVICGDFNVRPDSETLRILRQAGMGELVTEGRHAGTRTSHYAKPERFADYMLVDANLNVAGFEVIREPEVSDHCPLLLTI